MITDAIRDCSRRGDIVLDPFGGSGTTLIAAERVGRKARLIEIDPQCTDLIVRRFQAVTGRTAVLAGDGRSFDAIAAARRMPECCRCGGTLMVAKSSKGGGGSKGKAATRPKTSASGKVGPGNPPLHTRFKPGQSGNPDGRPKGSKNFAALLDRELRRLVTVEVNGKPRRKPAQELIARRLTLDSMKGMHKAIELVMRLSTAAQPKEDSLPEATFEMPDKEALRESGGASRR